MGFGGILQVLSLPILFLGIGYELSKEEDIEERGHRANPEDSSNLLGLLPAILLGVHGYVLDMCEKGVYGEGMLISLVPYVVNVGVLLMYVCLGYWIYRGSYKSGSGHVLEKLKRNSRQDKGYVMSLRLFAVGLGIVVMVLNLVGST